MHRNTVVFLHGGTEEENCTHGGKNWRHENKTTTIDSPDVALIDPLARVEFRLRQIRELGSRSLRGASGDRVATVDYDRLAGHEASRRAREAYGDPRYVVGLTDASQRAHRHARQKGLWWCEGPLLLFWGLIAGSQLKKANWGRWFVLLLKINAWCFGLFFLSGFFPALNDFTDLLETIAVLLLPLWMLACTMKKPPGHRPSFSVSTLSV